MNEDIVRLIDDMESPDPVIRGLASNIFLNIKDEKLFPELFERSRSSTRDVKSFFIRLLTLVKKGGFKKYFLSFLADRDEKISNEACMAIRKTSSSFNLDDLRAMIASNSPRENAVAIEILAERPFSPLDRTVVENYLKYSPVPERLEVLKNALRYAVAHAGPGGTDAAAVSAAVMDIIRTAFSNSNAPVFEVVSRHAHLLVAPGELVALYEANFHKNEKFDELIVGSALRIGAPPAPELLSRIARSPKFTSDQRCRAVFAFARSGTGEAFNTCIDLMCDDSSPKSLGYSALMALLNIDPARLETLSEERFKKANSSREAFEVHSIFDTCASKNQRAMDFLMTSFNTVSSPETGAMILATLYKKGMRPSPVFIRMLSESFHKIPRGPLRYFTAAALAMWLDSVGENPPVAAFFDECSRDRSDFIAFAESYIRRVEEEKIENRGFYRKFLEAVLDSEEPNLVCAAIVRMPYYESLEFIHEFILLCENVRLIMFGAMIRDSVVGLLLKNSDSLEHFLDGVGRDRIKPYVSALKDTGHFNVISAFVRKFFREDGALAGMVDEELTFLLKDSIYSILKRNIGRLFDMDALPVFGKKPFIDFISPIVMNVLEDVLVYRDCEVEDLSFLVRKTDRTLRFYGALMANIGYENKFFLFNVFQKYDGASAMELISGLS